MIKHVEYECSKEWISKHGQKIKIYLGKYGYKIMVEDSEYHKCRSSIDHTLALWLRMAIVKLIDDGLWDTSRYTMYGEEIHSEKNEVV